MERYFVFLRPLGLRLYREKYENDGKLENEQLGEFLIQLAQCRGLFRIIKLGEIPTPAEVTAQRKKMEAMQRKQYRTNYHVSSKNWFFEFAAGLDQYAFDLDLLEKLNMTRFMLDALTDNGNDKQSPYSTIRVVLQGDWMLQMVQSCIDCEEGGF